MRPPWVGDVLPGVAGLLVAGVLVVAAAQGVARKLRPRAAETAPDDTADL